MPSRPEPETVAAPGAAFARSWLALREPADIAARNPDVLDACRRAFAGRDRVAICDLGAGTGASVRAFAGLLPPTQRWTLVDRDPGLLAAVQPPAGFPGLTLETAVRELARDPACWPAGTGLVTASALLDLVSPEWIERLVGALAADRIAFLATLSFDGVMTCEPEHPLDDAMNRAFHAHQKRDKGFGPAAGPDAATVLEQALRRAGFEVTVGDSPWRLDASAPELLRETLEGIATAAREMGLGDAADAWLKDRHGCARRLTIGHRDIFARL